MTAILSLAALSAHVQAQAPGLLWTTNIGAQVFAVDSQENVYAHAGATVIKLSPTGTSLQTNVICPVPAYFAERDSSDDFYFTGSFDGTQNFGGITLVGGWINNINFNPPQWQPGYPTVFLAKYDGAGTLLWAVSFGQGASVNVATDLVIAPDGSLVAAFRNTLGFYLRNYSAIGSNRWERLVMGNIAHPFFLPGQIRIASDNVTNCYYVVQQPTVGIGGWFNSASGDLIGFGLPPVVWPERGTNSKPAVCDGLGAALAGKAAIGSGEFVMYKYLNSGGREWTNALPNADPWTLGGDSQGSIYVTDTNAVLYRYDCTGNLIWSTNLGSRIDRMIIRGGTRLLSFQNGVVGRLTDEAPAQAPSIRVNPQPQTAFVGDNVQLAVTADGTPPLHYSWRLNGAVIAGATGPAYSFSNAESSQTGLYSVLVTNVAGATTSAPALVRVKSVQLYHGDQMLTNGTYHFAAPPTLTIRSAFTNGSSFYTLDGSPPSFASTYYSGPFVLSHSATVRAIGYSADFSQSDEADTVSANVLANHTLTVTATGGGSVSLNPPGGTYVATNVVSATALPEPGWYFLYWLGDASGPSPTINVAMERDKAIHAVFGTTLFTTVAGNGSVQVWPPGGVHPLGTTLRLTAMPQPGDYFGFWGNAATGSTNPLCFTITGPNQTVSSIFAPLLADQSALTVLINGHGSVSTNPRANAYPTNQSVTLTALPDVGQSFVNWSGDASGTQNPLTVSMSQSRVITANFSSRPWLRVDRAGVEGFTPAGFRFTVVSDPQTAHEIRASTNLSTWAGLGRVTNDFGEVQFTDTNALSAPASFYQAAP